MLKKKSVIAHPGLKFFHTPQIKIVLLYIHPLTSREERGFCSSKNFVRVGGSGLHLVVAFNFKPHSAHKI